MPDRRHDFYLLTPGPLTVPPEIKAEMLRDRSPNAAEHAGKTQAIRRYLLSLCGGEDSHVCVLLQGSATYGIEAGFQTLVPEDAKVMVIENGFYGRRLAEIVRGARREVTVADFPMLPLPTGEDVDRLLAADPAVTHLALCHAETGTGVLNRVAEIAAAARARGVEVLVDAVASFGGFPLDAAALDLLAIFISPNKCLESVPGVAAVIARRDALEASAGRCRSAVLDLHAQAKFMDDTGGQWRWTPPTHVVAALAKGCERHEAEGGVGPRGARYRRCWKMLVDGLRQRGLRTLLPDEVAAPIIATMHDPEHPAYAFPAFYAALEKRGVVIFPGRLTSAGTFRIGVMGDIVEQDIAFVLHAIDEAFAEIGVDLTEPARP